MKLFNQYKKILAVSAVAFLGACAHEAPLTETQLDLSTPAKTELDNWIDSNYLVPYNINVQYKWNQNAVDNNRFLFPPLQSKVQPVLEIIQKIWLDSYKTVAGPDFVKVIAPREFVLVGGINLNTTGTITLGLAEGGKRITFFNTDYIDVKDKAQVNRFIHTIQHEYIHILNQTKPFDEKSMATITPTGYSSAWYNTSDAVALEEGFLTAYAKSNINEDFAETASTILISSKTEYAAILASIVSPTALAAIKAKEAIVVKYYKDAFGIDLYALRDEAQKNTLAIIK